MEDQQAYIRDEVNRLKNRQVKAQSLPKTKPQQKSFLSTFLATSILLVMIATMGGIVLKTSVFADSGKEQRDTVVVRNHYPDRPVRPVVPAYMTASEGQALSDRVESMEYKTKVWSHRAWLLSLAVNENANIDKDIDRRYHGNRDSGFIQFDQAWQMNKMPESMDLSQEQRDSIRNGPK
jgi:hypothetical protein